MISRSEVLVVIPAFNEAATVARVVREVKEEGFLVVVVDDGSSDFTASLSSDAGAKVLRLPVNSGVGGALHTGFRYAINQGFRAVIQCDGDGQHFAHYLNELLDRANHSGADMVIGSRFSQVDEPEHVQRLRRLAMKGLALLASIATEQKLNDATSGFRIITQPLLGEFAESFPTYYLGDTFEAVVVAGRAGYKVEEISVKMGLRLSGSSTSTAAGSVVLIAKALFLTIFKFHFRIKTKN